MAALGHLLRSKIVLAVLIGLAAVYFRAVAVQTTIIEEPIRNDAREYYLSAHNLVHHGIYSRSPATLTDPRATIEPDAYRPPGLPLVIAAVLSTSSSVSAVFATMQSLNILIGVAAAVALFVAAAAMLPLPAAFVAGLMLAASPHLVSISVYLLTEPFAICLVALLLMASTMRVLDSGRTRILYFLLLGALVGCLALFRPIFIAFAPFLWLAFDSRRDRFAALIFGCAGAACVVAPWLVRNWLNVVDGDGSLIAATMLDGSYRGYIYAGDASTFPYARLADPMFETARQTVSRAIGEIATRLASDPLGSAVWYLIEKPGYLLRWDNVDGAGDVFVYPALATPFTTDLLFRTIHRAYRATHDLVVLLAAVGCAMVWIAPAVRLARFRRPHGLRMASLLLIFLYAAHFPFFAATRYALPVFPCLYVLCLVPLLVGARWLAERTERLGRTAAAA